jgi:HSP20 family molecular chaperone IbpA
LEVEVLPTSITIEGTARRCRYQQRVDSFLEFGVKRLLRHFDLPACIDPDETTATVDEGMLRIVAKKPAVGTSPTTAGKITRPVAA